MAKWKKPFIFGRFGCYIIEAVLLVNVVFGGPIAGWSRLSTTDSDIPPPNDGDEQTASLIADIDGDGVNDFIIAERTRAPAVVWFRRQVRTWSRYIIDDDALWIEAGGACYDIDDDGDVDIVFGGDSSSDRMWWWENPQPDYAPDVPWVRRPIKWSGGSKHHDQVFGDVDGDGKVELVTWNQQLKLFEIPEEPRNYPDEWPRTTIAGTSNSMYEGLAIADVDRDGKDDIVGAGRWYRHLSDAVFEEHIIDDDAGREATRVAVGQLVAGGRIEVVLGPGDIDGPLVWYQWDGGTWTGHQLVETVVHGHSLSVVDINGDGCLDIFTAEMGDPGAGAAAKAWIFYGDGKGNFRAQVISTGIGNHESKTGDLDGDGDIDILMKPYHYGAPRLDIWLNSRQTDGFGDLAILINNWLAGNCGEPDFCHGCDLDFDGKVSFIDYAYLSAGWSGPASPPGDMDGDFCIGCQDLGFFALMWLRADCDFPDYCGGADINFDGTVAYADFAAFALSWHECAGLP